MTDTRWPNVLFLDQSGQLGGAEFALLDIVRRWEGQCRVVTFESGLFPQEVGRAGVDCVVADYGISSIRRESGPVAAVHTVNALRATTAAVNRQAGAFELIYANTQKAAVVGAMVATARRIPLIVHLHDILTDDHFSRFNQTMSRIALSRAQTVIADSEATANAYTQVRGGEKRTTVIHYGFEDPEPRDPMVVRRELGIDPTAPTVGIFSRLSPWKGQEVVLDAMAQLPDVQALIVGDALFGETAFARELARRAETLNVSQRVHFLGFRKDVADLMAACDLTIHASTAPEPFGRVIVESMLTGTPVVATNAGGPQSILTENHDGWLVPPAGTDALVAAVRNALSSSERLREVGENARTTALEQYPMSAYIENIRSECHRAVGGNDIV